MKYLLTISLTILFTTLLTCQETRLVVGKTASSKFITESYYVLKSNKKVKHGEYKKYFRVTKAEYKKICKGQLDEGEYINIQGNYLEGKKDGEWIEYSEPHLVKSKKYYKKGGKTGVWETVHEKGQVVERYDYTENKKLKPILSSKLHYPYKAMELGIQGTVSVSFKMHADCSVTDIVVIKSLSPECDQVVIDQIKEIAALSRKYDLGCEEKTETIDIEFKMQ